MNEDPREFVATIEKRSEISEEKSNAKNFGDMKEISLVLRHTELDSEDYIAITIKSETDTIDDLIQKAKNAFPKKVKKQTDSMEPIN